ncbi:hypothetical protein N7453_001724 [Penicillium expansum]|nr:hypothetical protein N7453_001724 [Penicillium expansum]
MVVFFSFAVLVLATAAAASSPQPVNYKDASLPVEERVSDLLSRMTIEEKTAQLIQGDIANWMNSTTGAFNESGLIENMALKAGSFYVGYPTPGSWISKNIQRAQDFNSPIGYDLVDEK